MGVNFVAKSRDWRPVNKFFAKKMLNYRGRRRFSAAVTARQTAARGWLIFRVASVRRAEFHTLGYC